MRKNINNLKTENYYYAFVLTDNERFGKIETVCFADDRDTAFFRVNMWLDEMGVDRRIRMTTLHRNTHKKECKRLIVNGNYLVM